MLNQYDVTHGVLAIDDTDKRRAKKTTRIANAHKVKDKGTGGYFRGQQLIFMVLVTDIVTIPVGFRWYRPDPAMTAWYRENKKLKKAGVHARQAAASQTTAQPRLSDQSGVGSGDGLQFHPVVPYIQGTGDIGRCPLWHG